MRRKKAESVGDLMHRFIRSEGLETPLNEHRAVAAWMEVMGVAVARYTTRVYIRNGVLYVQLTSPALRANLMMGRKQLTDRINAYVGSPVVSDVIFR